jgi:putative transposase
MTQINLNLNTQQIQDIISNSGANDLAKQMLTTIFNQLMEKERDEYIHVDAYSREDHRTSTRNGYYERNFTTRIGRLELIVPRTRDGEFSPTIFERYQRNEKALLSTMLEMYVQGVSTRKVSKVVEELCGTSVSKSFISSLTSQLDESVSSFLNRPLERHYPFILSDVLYIKVRENHRVVSKAFHIILGINDCGERELLSFSLSDSEAYET